MRKAPPALVVGLLSLVALTGCTTLSQGHATPTSTTASTEVETTSSSSSGEPSVEELPSHGAPKVETPLQADGLADDPCRSLTEAHAQTLNVNYPGRPYEGPTGKMCDWVTDGPNSGRVSVGFVTNDPTGLSSAYKSNENGEFAYFEPLDDVDGFPAVAFGITDGRAGGSCAVAVGISDDMAFTITLTLSGKNVGKRDPCEASTQVAGMVLQTIKES